MLRLEYVSSENVQSPCVLTMKHNISKFRIMLMLLVSSIRLITRLRPKRRACVIILTKSPNNYANLRRAISSYRNNTSAIEFCVVESGEPLAETDWEFYVVPAYPFHYNKYVKSGIDAINVESYDAIVISNDDVIALPNAIDRLFDSGFESCSPIDPSETSTQRVWKPTVGYSVEYHLKGWCLFISKSLLLKYSPKILFHDNYHFYLQDVFYASLLEQLGEPHALVPQSKVVHLGHSSQGHATSDILRYDHLVSRISHDVSAAVDRIQKYSEPDKNVSKH